MRTYPSALRPDVSVVLPEGRLDADAAPSLDAAILALEALGAQNVIVDLSSCTYISSSGLRAIISHVRRLRRVDGDLKLCCPSPRVQHVLDIAGLDSVLSILPSEAAATAAFSAPVGTASGQQSPGSAGPERDPHGHKG